MIMMEYAWGQSTRAGVLALPHGPELASFGRQILEIKNFRMIAFDGVVYSFRISSSVSRLRQGCIRHASSKHSSTNTSWSAKFTQRYPLNTKQDQDNP